MPKRTARRSMSYKGCNKKTSMSTVLVNIRLIKIKAIMMVAPIRSAASTLGRGRLGYDPESFGTHSIRIGAAMVIHLGGCATFIIMILCRWKVAASMGCIREQIAEFREGVSQRMFFPRCRHRLPPKRSGCDLHHYNQLWP
jgi:hypothetical protein